MRPRTIDAFQWLMFAGLVLGVMQSISHWDVARTLTSPLGIILAQMLSIVVVVTLVLLITLRRSNSAKWALVVLYALGLVGLLVAISRGIEAGLGPIKYTQTAVQGVAIAMLFTRLARAWLGARRQPHKYSTRPHISSGS